MIRTNGASQNITENERAVARRRGAMAILPGLPQDSTSAARPLAVRLCERLVDKGLVRHVVEEHHFEDDYKFYRFVPPST